MDEGLFFNTRQPDDPGPERKRTMSKSAKLGMITSPGSAAPKAVVEVKSAWSSKINWGEALKVIAMVLAYFGYDLDPQVQVYILQAIIGIGAAYTWIMRTFFTSTVTPSSQPPGSVTE